MCQCVDTKHKTINKQTNKQTSAPIHTNNVKYDNTKQRRYVQDNI